ncbi:cysteine--tRNA ligase [Leucobacter sp. CSA1]|uniref:Cysteine--tRNA ligase n=1 Tax=Leucobacter chromiisoli TaxID=2796471 RepID=A0A934Q9X1_9MICO|nr:cysteine--tRNA ligase [Leucobacter chromiisoli]MBK0419965.1 cysteine--tRNA ligase [Leucobacter chromiisoli]
MKQRIYDSQRQELVDLDPRVPGEVGMYVCGPTVQSAPHIGHLRSALAYDLIRRWLTASGQRVTLIRNVTDIDDKILDNARLAQEAGGSEEWWALAYRVEREFTAAYDAIGVQPPTYEPRATANIREMIALIERLIERGHAYPAEDGTASVYFDTASWPAYGALTRQQRDQMEDAADGDPSSAAGKRDPRDFALWKAHRDSEPETAAWPSPWGAGRPGWHIECSAMATRYLGEEFDIHGGGLDLRFPHHENELAQSTAAGHPFARHWIHNGLVNTGGQKMSKSLGNSLFAADLLAAARPIVLRYFLGSAHYRSVLEFSESSLAEAAAAFGRIENLLDRVEEAGLELPPAGAAGADPRNLPRAFVEAMLDDFAVPQALAVLHGAVRAANTQLDDPTGGDRAEIRELAQQIAGMLDVLGLNPRDPAWLTSGGSGDEAAAALGELVEALLEQRADARRAKDFATSDAIRDRLQAVGITIEDSPNGTRWSLA